MIDTLVMQDLMRFWERCFVLLEWKSTREVCQKQTFVFQHQTRMSVCLILQFVIKYHPVVSLFVPVP